MIREGSAAHFDLYRLRMRVGLQLSLSDRLHPGFQRSTPTLLRYVIGALSSTAVVWEAFQSRDL